MNNVLMLIAIISCALLFSCNIEDETYPIIVEDALPIPYADNFDNGNDLRSGLANFTIVNDKNELDELEPLMVEDNSINAVSYEWDFGNGDKSFDANPSYSYKIHGYYTVSLTIKDSYGDVTSTSQDILVLCLFGGGDHSQ